MNNKIKNIDKALDIILDNRFFGDKDFEEIAILTGSVYQLDDCEVTGRKCVPCYKLNNMTVMCSVYFDYLRMISYESKKNFVSIKEGVV